MFSLSSPHYGREAVGSHRTFMCCSYMLRRTVEFTNIQSRQTIAVPTLLRAPSH